MIPQDFHRGDRVRLHRALDRAGKDPIWILRVEAAQVPTAHVHEVALLDVRFVVDVRSREEGQRVHAWATGVLTDEHGALIDRVFDDLGRSAVRVNYHVADDGVFFDCDTKRAVVAAQRLYALPDGSVYCRGLRYAS